MTAIVVWACMGAAASGAQAATITLSLSTDPAEEQAFTITAAGTADASGRVEVFIRPAGGAPCASNAANETGSRIVFGFASMVGSYSFQDTHMPPDPGSFLLCGYLGNQGVAPQAATSATVAVRPNRATLAISAPATGVPDQPVLLNFQGATEVQRRLFVRIKPVGGAACGSASSTDAGGESVLNGNLIQGAYAVPQSRTFTAGAYVICAWVQEHSTDLAPDAFASASIVVQPPDADADGIPDASDRCPTRPAPNTPTGCPPRVAPVAFSAAVTPRRDRRAPYTFGFSGWLTPPRDLVASTACKGVVSVQIKRGGRTISTRHRFVRANCTWASSVRFANRSRIGRSGRLKVSVRFLGNDVLSPRSAPSLNVRAG